MTSRDPSLRAAAAAAGTLLLLAAAVLPESAAAQLPPSAAQACARQTDDADRLACYDGLFRRRGDEAPSAAPASSLPAQRRGTGGATAAADESSPLSKFWELGPGDKRARFTVRTYLPNYFLPLHNTSGISQPSSPTHPAEPANVRYRPVEAKLQVSLRAKAAEDLVLPGLDLWLAFTQRSIWQIWNPQESSPFRSSDYQPEGLLVWAVPPPMRQLPGGWSWRLLQFGLAHQSNGQGGSLSRSWNRAYAGGAIEHGEFGLQARANWRVLRSRRIDDNPDIERQLGRYELLATWLPGRATAALIWRTDLRQASGGSLQFDWSYPVFSEQPQGLRWYVQVFTGTGETLIDYNNRQTSLGLGLSLFQF